MVKVVKRELYHRIVPNVALHAYANQQSSATFQAKGLRDRFTSLSPCRGFRASSLAPQIQP